MKTLMPPKTRAWNDTDWRDRYLHIVSDDEHAADLLAEALTAIDHRHPYALCGVSLVSLRPGDAALPANAICPECAALNGG